MPASPPSPPSQSGALRRAGLLLLLAAVSAPRAASLVQIGGSSLAPPSRPRPFRFAIHGVGGPYTRDARVSSGRRVLMSTTGSGNANVEVGRRSRSKKTAVAAVALGFLAFASSAPIANAAKTAAKAVETVAPPLVLPSIKTLALACLLPALSGYYKSEYGVSYGYGTAIAASSYMILSPIASAAGLPLLPAIGDYISLTSFQYEGVKASLCATLQNLKALLPASLPAFHAFSLLFYGTRLDLFLLYRELFLPRFRAMRERIEERAKKQGGRITRTPFLVSCGFLYFCMACPLLVTSQLCGEMGMSCGPILALPKLSGGAVPILEQSVRLSVVAALAGFLLGALGDLNKTLGKALQGEDALVTWGVFRLFRHPNYTGEVIGWTASCLAGFLAVARKAAGDGSLAIWRSMAPYLLLSAMGAAGISFVLATATTGLEFRQKEKYGETEEYKRWIERSWVGFKMAPAQKDSGGDE